MNENENKPMGLTEADDIEHIREIEKMLGERNDDKSVPVKRYMRKSTSAQSQPKTPAAAPVEASTIIINRVDLPEHSGSPSSATVHEGNKSAGHTNDQKRTVNQSSDSAKVRTDRTQSSSKAPVSSDSPRKPGQEPKKASSDNRIKDGSAVSTKHPAINKAKAPAKDDSDYTPLLTENDDFELDDDPEPDNIPGGAVTALTSVAKAVIYLISVLLVSILLAVGIISVANDIFAFVKDTEPVTVVVPENCSTEMLSEILAESGAIKYPEIFNFYIKFKKKESAYLPGTYQISPMLNYDYMIYEFKEKKPARTTVVVTIPEGYSTDQIVKLLVEKGLGTYEGYKRAINEYDFEYKFLENVDTFSPDRYWRLDGYLYPDTYYYYSDSTEETVVYKMLENFNNKFTEEYYARADELGMSVDNLITLASMIQKEVRFADEFGNVSSVFHNRLNSPASYPYLDSDATIMYAIEHDTGERPKSLTETSYESPYNTYKNRGLPPGPISNPSIEAIRYAMYPSKSGYYYFVSGPDGRTVFSRTYPEHQEAIADLY